MLTKILSRKIHEIWQIADQFFILKYNPNLYLKSSLKLWRIMICSLGSGFKLLANSLSVKTYNHEMTSTVMFVFCFWFSVVKNQRSLVKMKEELSLCHYYPKFRREDKCHTIIVNQTVPTRIKEENKEQIPWDSRVQLSPERKNRVLQIHVCWATVTLGRL